MDKLLLDKALEVFSQNIRRKQHLPQPIAIDVETGFHMIRRIGKMFCANFVIDSGNQPAFEQFVWYFTHQRDRFHGDISKGILAVGRKGTGKTLAMVIMQHFLEFFDKSGQMNGWDFKPLFRIVKCTEIKSDFSDQDNGGLKVLKPYKTRHDIWCFDDIGEEVRDQTMATHYGVQINILENILTTRAEMFKIHRTPTHGTSNYPIVSSDKKDTYFERFYGDRIADRALEMFNVIRFEGKSRRK